MDGKEIRSAVYTRLIMHDRKLLMNNDRDGK